MRSVTSQIPAILAILAVLALSAAVSAKPPAAAEGCSSCHNEDGVSDDEDVPIIAGASAFFLENQLLMFKEDARPCVQEEFSNREHESSANNHCALAKQLSENRITELAAYYSDQPFRSADQEVDGSLAKIGENIHKQRCARCHSNDDSLAGQWKAYLISTLKTYQDGKRWQPKRMKSAVDGLSEKDIKALAEYYAKEGQR